MIPRAIRRPTLAALLLAACAPEAPPSPPAPAPAPAAATPTTTAANAAPTPTPDAAPTTATPEPLPAIPTTAPDAPAAPTPPDLDDALDRCQSDTLDRPARIAGCRALLDRPGGDDTVDPNLAPERADAIQALRALKATSPVKPALQRRLGKLRACLVVHETATVVSLACRAAMCGEPAAWTPFELILATGALKTQQC